MKCNERSKTMSRNTKVKTVVVVAALTGAASLFGASAFAADLTIASWGGSYQKAQSKALFEPAAKALGITIKQVTYGGMSDVRLQVKTGAVSSDIVASGSGSAARTGDEGFLGGGRAAGRGRGGREE